MAPCSMDGAGTTYNIQEQQGPKPIPCIHTILCFFFLFSFSLLLRQNVNMPTPKYRRHLTTCQSFMSRREKISKPRIKPPTSSILSFELVVLNTWACCTWKPIQCSKKHIFSKRLYACMWPSKKGLMTLVPTSLQRKMQAINIWICMAHTIHHWPYLLSCDRWVGK